MSVKVIVATHKLCDTPTDAMYLPVHVGAANKEPLPFVGDNTGEHISDKNDIFSELTGLYWAWKNLEEDYIGLVHYRRYFVSPSKRCRKKLEAVLSTAEAEQLLQGRDGILPARRHYVIESLYSHYEHTCYVEPLETTREIIAEKYPTYIPSFDRLRKRTSAHMFNMFILRRDHLDAYCAWLFDILLELERRVDASQYEEFQARFCGRVSELLLDVWLEQNPLDCVTLPLIHIGYVNWFGKGMAFLAAKFFGKKYEKSF